LHEGVLRLKHSRQKIVQLMVFVTIEVRGFSDNCQAVLFLFLLPTLFESGPECHKIEHFYPVTLSFSKLNSISISCQEAACYGGLKMT